MLLLQKRNELKKQERKAEAGPAQSRDQGKPRLREEPALRSQAGCQVAHSTQLSSPAKTYLQEERPHSPQPERAVTDPASHFQGTSDLGISPCLPGGWGGTGGGRDARHHPRDLNVFRHPLLQNPTIRPLPRAPAASHPPSNPVKAKRVKFLFEVDAVFGFLGRERRQSSPLRTRGVRGRDSMGAPLP